MNLSGPRPFYLAALAVLPLAALLVTVAVLKPGTEARRIQRPCGGLHWAAGAYPVTVQIDESAADWADAFGAAAGRWTVAARRDLFRVERAGVTAWADYAEAFAGVGPEPTGRVLVVSGRGQGAIIRAEDDEDGHARIRWRLGSCEIGYGAIRVPDGERPSEAVMLAIAEHELGHAIGIGHAGDPRSVMFPDVQHEEPGKPWFPPRIAPAEAALAAESFPAWDGAVDHE